MTIDKAIEVLNPDNGILHSAEETEEAMRLAVTALELLKAQEPLVIPKMEVDEIYDYIAECPECGMVWTMCHSEKMRFCPGCGKAVKWDDA